MLISFQIENFRSILDVSVDMAYAERKAPNGYKQMDLLPFIEKQKLRTVPCLALYGANASGKTNIIKAFQMLHRIVRNKYNPNFFNPNKLHNSFEYSLFKIEFSIHSNYFVYELAINDTQIIREELLKNENLVFAINGDETNFSALATDMYPMNKLKTIFSVECLDKYKKYRTPFLTTVGEHYAGLDTELTDAFIFITQKLEVYEGNTFPFTLGLKKLAKINNDENVQPAFNTIVQHLRKLDIDITRMDFKQNEQEMYQQERNPHTYELIHDVHEKKTLAPEINSYHRNAQGEEVQFDFNEESAGTQRVACLLGVVMSALKQGHIVVIDELGNSLHPMLFAEIVRMFKDKRYNTSNAQLVFATHNTDIMDQEMMRISEVGIVKKTLKKGTMLRRISDFEGVRNVTKFRKQYLDGNFSGIPYPYI